MKDENYVIENARIINASLDIENGFLDMSLTLEFSCGCQSFGVWALHLPKSHTHYKLEGIAGHFIMRCFEIAEVTNFKDLVGKTIRAEHNDNRISAIGHIIKNDWFIPSIDL